MRKYSAIIIGMLGTYLFMFTGCTSSNQPSSTALSLMPLAVGNQWVYRVTSLDTNGVVTGVENDTIRVLKDTTFGGQTCYVLSSLNTDRSPGYFQSRSDGIWAPSGNSYAMQKWFSYPAKVGDTTMIYSHDPVVVRNVDTLVAGPGGAWRCCVYNLDNVFIEYYAPGVGLCREEFWYESLPSIRNYNYERRELLSYSLK